MTVKMAIPFDNRIRYHEGVVLRAAIALKALYGPVCTVMVITTQDHYVGTLQGHFNAQAPIVCVTPENAKGLLNAGFTAVFASELHPEYRKFQEMGCGLLVLPKLFNLELDSSSVVFGNSFSIPDTRPMLEMFRGLKRVREPFVLR